jgi:hypothetical protein
VSPVDRPTSNAEHVLRLLKVVAAGLLLVLASAGVARAQTQSVTAMWDANTDAYTVGYRLYYGTAPGSYTQDINVGNVTSHPLPLARGATYYFVVRAYNSSAQLGPASNEATIALVTAPPPTATLTGTRSGTNTANVTWTTANATSVTVNGASVALSGSATYTISAATTYTLVATGPGGSVTRTATVTPVAAPTATLTATRSGTNTANVSWTTANATSVTVSGASVALSGSATYTISAATTYTLVATGPGGSVTRTATVSPLPSATLTATLSGSNTANVSWSTSNATSVTLNGASVSLSGSTSYTISAATTYTLVATGPGGSVTRTDTVTPVAAPTATLTATRSGTNTAHVSWTTSNATSVTLNGTAVALSGSASDTISGETTYTLVATGAGGSVTRTATVTPVGAPTATLTATRSGTNTANVSWTTANATSVTLNGASVALSGSASYTISAATTYTLVATGPGGSVTRTATVTLVAAPTATLTATRSGTNTANVSWTTANATSVTLNGAAVALSGSARNTISAATTYTLVATGPGGSVTRTAMVTPVAMPTAQLNATIRSADAVADTATLTWQTTNATSATINGVAVALSGSMQRTVTATTTFTLVAVGPGGTATDSETITVTGVDCVVSAWSFQSATAWSTCTGGQQSRTETWARTIITQPSNGGAACPALAEQRVATETCSEPTPTVPGTPVNVKATVSGSRVTLSWSPGTTGGAPTGYYLSAGTSPGGSQLANSLSVGNTLSVSGDLRRDTYYARVRAGNAAGDSAYSTEISFRIGAKSRPRKPGGFTGSLQGSVATLSWTAPAGDGEDAPTGYVIEAGSAGGLMNLATVPLGNVTSFQAVNVPLGVYYVRVRAVNELGAGVPSDEIVLQPGPGTGQPLNLTSSGQGSMVQLGWQAPSTGEVPTGYLIEAGSGPGLANLAVLQVGNATTFSTTAPPGVYYVRVRAVSAYGVAGQASNEIVVRR